MFEEAAEGGAPAVARGRRIRAVSFDVIEEGDDRVRVQVLEGQRRDISALAVCRELEQKLHRIAVGSNRMRACPTLAGQIFEEERFDARQQRPWCGSAHRGGQASRRCRSNRLLASSSSSGVALK